MINGGMFCYQGYAPKYQPRDSYLLWHQGVLELRVWEGLPHHFNRLPKDLKDKLQITIQTNCSEDKYSLAITNNQRIKIMKETVLYLVDFAKQERIAIGIPDIYYNHPSGSEPVFWLPK